MVLYRERMQTSIKPSLLNVSSQLQLSLLFIASLSPSVCGLNIDLVSQFDPFPGDNRYADVWGEGDFAYIGAFNGSGVGIIDISDSTTPTLAEHYNPANGQFKDIKVQNGIGYFVSDNGGGVHIVDLSDPTSPSLNSQITAAISGYDSAHNVFISNGFLYEADSHTPTVKVFDVTDSANPVFVRNIVTTDSSYIHDITVIDDRLYTSGFGGTTDIYDVASIGTTAPTLLGTVNSGSNSHSNWVTSDNSLLISARELSDGEVRIIDVSDPGNPTLLSTIDKTLLGIDAFSPHNPVLFDDKLLFVSWYQAGVQAIDISDPSSPALVGSFDTFPGAVSGFDGNWGVYPFLGLDKVLLSDLDGGLFVVDATAVVPEPSNLTLFGIVILSLFGYGRRRQKPGHKT
jgi:choice-of-anchor B domain-containing protein